MKLMMIALALGGTSIATAASAQPAPTRAERDAQFQRDLAYDREQRRLSDEQERRARAETERALGRRLCDRNCPPAQVAPQ